MLTQLVASIAFVKAGVAHGLRLELVLRPGSWEDRGPAGGFHHNHMYDMMRTHGMLTVAVPCMSYRRATVVAGGVFGCMVAQG